MNLAHSFCGAYFVTPLDLANDYSVFVSPCLSVRSLKSLLASSAVSFIRVPAR